LSANKDDYHLSWEDIADLINEETGENKSEGFFRRWFPPYAEGFDDGVRSVLERNDTETSEDEYTLKRISMEKEKVKLSDYRSDYNRMVRASAREDILASLMIEEIKKLIPYNVSNLTINDSDNDLFVSLNDIHFGVDIDNHWNKYNPEIARHRFEVYLANIKKIQKLHKSKKCYVNANGDLISGNIHKTIQLSNRENVVKQIMGISELISWFLSELCGEFDEVIFACVAGNHSRLSKKKESPKDERLDDIIPFYVKARLQNINNISYIDNDIDNTFNIVSIRGKKYLNVHGDYDSFNNIYKLLDMIDDKIYCIHFGHLHHNCSNSYQNYKTIMCGSFQGVDDFCIENRIYSNAEQMVCVCTEDGILCQYPVILQ
jgi:hypothetical protein